MGQRCALHGDPERRATGEGRRGARPDGVPATPEAQAYTYDKGYFYPGPAVKNVPLSMAPKESQDAVKEFGRPSTEKWLAEFPHTQSLPPAAQVEAFRIWDEQVGAKIKK